jgi:molybdopterin-containing oxidoreductase family membrane subunit
MSHIYDSSIKPLVIGDKTYHDVTVDVAAVEGKANKHWWIVFSIALTFLWGLGCIALCLQGGTWGLNKTVGWAWDITNFVWWVLVTLEH